MAAQSESFDVAVVGGGAIGLACALRARRAAARASVVVDAGEPGAWHVAAGMLAPVSEAEFGEGALLAAGPGELRAATPASWPSSDDPGYRAVGTLWWPATATRRRRSTAWPRSARTSACRSSGCGPAQARRLEPALAPTVRLALDVETDHSIDPRKLVAALAPAVDAAARRGRTRGAARCPANA